MCCRWNNLAVELRSRNDRFGQCLEQWQLYDDQYKSATDWLADKERQYNQLNALKDNPSQRQQCLQESKVSSSKFVNGQLAFLGLSTTGQMYESICDGLETDEKHGENSLYYKGNSLV